MYQAASIYFMQTVNTVVDQSNKVTMLPLSPEHKKESAGWTALSFSMPDNGWQLVVRFTN